VIFDLDLKTAPYFHRNNVVYSQPIFIIVGTHRPKL